MLNILLTIIKYSYPNVYILLSEYYSLSSIYYRIEHNVMYFILRLYMDINVYHLLT